MEAWSAWSRRAGNAVVDLGAPLNPPRRSGMRPRPTGSPATRCSRATGSPPSTSSSRGTRTWRSRGTASRCSRCSRSPGCDGRRCRPGPLPGRQAGGRRGERLPGGTSASGMRCTRRHARTRRPRLRPRPGACCNRRLVGEGLPPLRPRRCRTASSPTGRGAASPTTRGAPRTPSAGWAGSPRSSSPSRCSRPPGRTYNNKILWVARKPLAKPSDLRITAQRMVGARPVGAPVMRRVQGGPGPSIIDLPRPGCWRFTLRWARSVDGLDLVYVPRRDR